MLDGNKVRAARKELGLTGRHFAKVVGLDPSTICRIERNELPGLSLVLALRVSWGLHKPICVPLQMQPVPHEHGGDGQPNYA